MFPETEHYLFIGGPKHGEFVEVVKNDPSHKVLAPSAQPQFFSNPLSDLDNAHPAYGVETYVRQEIGGELPDGFYKRAVYIHSELPNAQVAQQMLLSALMAEFLKGGTRIEQTGS